MRLHHRSTNKTKYTPEGIITVSKVNITEMSSKKKKKVWFRDKSVSTISNIPLAEHKRDCRVKVKEASVKFSSGN